MKSRTHCALLAFALFVFAGANVFGLDGDLEGLHKNNSTNFNASSPWVAGNLQDWKELDYIPCRVYLDGGPQANQPVTITFPKFKSGAPGFQNLYFLSNSPNVQIVSGPTLNSPPAPADWSYTMNVTVTSAARGYIYFYARLAAGAHLNVGSSLQLEGEPSLSPLQVHKPDAGPGLPDLAITKTGPSNAAAGEIITYTLSYTNKSTNDIAVGSQISDRLPSLVSFVSASDGGTNEGGTLTFDLGTVPARGSGTRTYQVRVATNATTGQSFTNDALIVSSEDDKNSADNSARWVVRVAQNRAPIGAPDSYGVNEDRTLSINAPGVLANDTDADGNSLTANLISTVSNGTLTLTNNGGFVYTPNTNFSGVDSFVYRAFDGTNFSSNITVTITVTNVNDRPVANPDTYGMNEDTTLVVNPPGVLGNDTDDDGDSLTSVIVTLVTAGTLTPNSDGSFTYLPPTNFTGVVTFNYVATDGSLTSAPVVVTINITNVNDAPVAVADDGYRAEEDTLLVVPATAGVLTNDFDVDNGAPVAPKAPAKAGYNGMEAILVTTTTHGTLNFDADGGFTYMPNTNFTGTDTFTYRATDGQATSEVALVTITIDSVNDVPFVQITSPTNGTVFGAPATINVIAEAGDIDGVVTNVDLYSGTNVIGTFTNGPYSVTLTNLLPGIYTFTATATDNSGITVTSTPVSITITGAPPTLACATNRSVELGTPWTFDEPTVTGTCGTNFLEVVGTVTNAGCGNSLTATRTWRVTDQCGNQVECSQTIAVVDTTAPNLVCVQGKTVELGAAWNFDEPSANDLGGVVTIAVINTVTNAGSCGNGYVATRTWSATDPCGNSNTCSQVVSVVDTTPPTIVCVSNKVVEAGSEWQFDAPTATDLSGFEIVVVGDTKFGAGCIGGVTRTWRATDACGNSNICSQTVTILDRTAPTITCVSNKTVELGSTWSFDVPSADDLNGAAIAVIATVTNSGTCGNGFVATRTWSATDDCGNSNTCSQLVTVVDTTAPALVCATNKTVELGSAWTFDEPTATDLSTLTIAVISTVTNTAELCGNGYVATRTWSGTDACGNSNVCSQVVTVVDTTAPTLICAENKTVELGTAWDFDAPDASDLSSNTISIVSTVTNSTCGAAFTATRTWAAVDACGNSNSCSQVVTVRDTTAPTIICADNKTVELGASWNFDEPTASDLSGYTIAVLGTVTNTATSCGNGYVATRSWSATDPCGNSNICSQVVTVRDTTAPTIVCATNKTVELGSVWAFDEPAATDLSSLTIAVLSTVTNTAESCGNGYVATRTWSGTDACGNSNVCSQVVTVLDTTAPTIVCVENKTVEAGTAWNFDAPTASDLSSNTVSIVSTVTNATCGAGFTATRVWSAIDACGNSNGCSQVVTVVDTTAPEIVCATNKTVELGSGWTFDEPSATDLSTFAISVTSTVTNTVESCGGGYVATRTWSATDACGNSNTCSQVVTVVDTTAPTIVCPQGKTVELGTAWSFDPPTATDLSSNTVSVLSTVTNSTCGAAFTATRTWVAVDVCGNSNTCSQVVTVTDTTPPTIVCADNKTVELGTEWSFNEPSATDLSTLTIAVIGTVTNTSESCGNGYVATRTWSATDACGNSNTCSQVVTVIDTTPPAIVCAENKTVEFGGEWTFDAPTATDLSSNTVSILSTVTNATCGGAFTATRTWVAVDACNNSNTCSQVVTVSDTTLPTIVCAENKTVELGTEWSFNEPTFSDLNSPTLSVLSTVTNITCGSAFVATRTWVASDACGNSNTCSQVVTVRDTTAPVITCAQPKTVQAGEEWTFDAPTATDLSSTTVSVVNTVTNFTCGGSFTATRTWRAADACENFSECSQTVSVVDNSGPTVTIISPTNNAGFVIPATFTVIASASDAGGVTSVQFFNGTNLLATLSNAPYFFVWSNAPVGTNKLTAVAADTCGNISTSTVVNVRLETNAFNVAGPIQLNPQNGRWEQVVNVTNTTSDTWLNGFRISITTTSRIENVTGTNNGVRYIDYPIALAPGAGTQVIIRYIQSGSRPTASLLVTPLPYPRPPLVAPEILPTVGETPQMPVAFNSSANRYYFLQYSDDLQNWTTEPTPVLGTGGVAQFEVNKNIPQRFFRVVLVP